MKILLFLVSIFTINLQAQTIKSFSGAYQLNKIKYDEYSVEYKDEKFLEGIATYTYYEDATGRIYHGSFKYTSKNVDGQVMVLQGPFKNGLKDGSWNMSITFNGSLISNNGKASIVGHEKLNGVFQNGLRTGLWTYDKNVTSKFSQYNAITKQYSTPQTKTEVMSSTANFIKGKFSNSCNYKSAITVNGSVTNVSVTGQFDKDCYMTGRWVYTEGVDQMVEEFVQGVNKSFVLKNLGTGVIKERDDNVEEQKLYQEYLQNPNTDVTGIELCEFCSRWNRGTDGGSFNQWIYYTPGTSDKNQRCIASNRMRNIGTLAERQVKKAEELKKEKELEERVNKEKVSRLEYTELKGCKTSNEIDNFIQKHPNSTYRNEALRSLYETLKDTASLRTYILRYPDSALRESAIDKIYSKCKSINDFQSLIKNYPDYSKIDDVKLQLVNLQRRYVDAYKEDNGRLKTEVDSKYISYGYNPLTSANDLKKYKKKHIYEAGMKLCSFYAEKYNNASGIKDDNLSQCLDDLANANSVLKRMIELSAIEDTKDLEKQLKSSDDINQIKLLLHL